MDIRIKICGLQREEDISYVNEVFPEYIGFVFVKDRRRYIEPERAAKLRKLLRPGIVPVGVFIDEEPRNVALLLEQGVIEAAQLHGQEDEVYIRELRDLTRRPLIKAFRVKSAEDVRQAEQSPADDILLDNGAGTGRAFDWSLLKDVSRPYFLAGGLCAENVAQALTQAHPFAVDVSTGVETDGRKDPRKIREFVRLVREL